MLNPSSPIPGGRDAMPDQLRCLTLLGITVVNPFCFSIGLFSASWMNGALWRRRIQCHRLLLAALFLAAPLAAWCEDRENPDAALARISSLFQTPNPLGAKFFTDYYGVFQGNPVGGLSQDFAYSQYLIFGVKLKEPLGWRRGSFKISAVSAAGRNLSEEIGNAFTVSQAWAGNSLFLYECFITQKAFNDRLELGLGRMAASEFFATLPAFDLLVSGGLNPSFSKIRNNVSRFGFYAAFSCVSR